MTSQHNRRVALHVLVKNGQNNTRILSNLTKLSERAVFYNKKKIREGKGPERKKIEFRARKLDDDDRRCISMLALSHPKWASEDIRRELLKRRHVDISTRTVLRTLNRAGITKQKPSKKPLLTEVQKQRRLEWCLEH